MSPYRAIRGRDFGGAHRSSSYIRHNAADQRRDRARRGACINGTVHGKATHGVRCLRCSLVHKLGASMARELDEFRNFKPVPLDSEHTTSSAAHAA